MAAQPTIQKQFEEQISQLTEIAARSSDVCLTAQVIAFSDATAREKFIAKLNSGYKFVGAHCLNEFGAPERARVVFDFDCAPGTFCLIRPSFLVVVHLVEKRVVHIEDPFIPSTSFEPAQRRPIPPVLPGAQGPFTLAIPSNANNVFTGQEVTAPFAARETAYLAGLPRPVPVPTPPPPPPRVPTSCSWGTETYCASPSLTQCPHYDDSNNDYVGDETTVDSAVDD